MKKSQIMYIESKEDGITGSGRIGRVTFSKSGKTIHYRGMKFQSLKGVGYKANYFDVETGEEYWILGCKRTGNDSLYPCVIEIDADVQAAYWTEVRNLPDRVNEPRFRSSGKHNRREPR